MGEKLKAALGEASYTQTTVAIDAYNSADDHKDVPIKAVNKIIDGFDAASVPDGITAERLDSL